jgi:hypothetical protein
VATATLITENLAGWAPGTHHYRCSDGRYLAVEADPLPEGTMIPVEAAPLVGQIIVAVGGDTRQAVKYVARPTVVFLTNEDGVAVDADENDHDPLTPLHTADPGTSHAEALAAMGYKVGRVEQ